MKREFKVGQVVWRGYRYWSGLSLLEQSLLGNPATGDHSGWNTIFIPYRIIAITQRRIKVQLLPDSINGEPATAKDKVPLFLETATLAGKGKKYHTRFHEFFYAVKPERDPEQRYRPSASISVLNLPAPFTAQDVNREYKRLARTVHPDAGGTHEQFIQLQRVRDEALRLAMP